MDVIEKDKIFRRDWTVDFSNRIIRTKDFSFIRRIKETIWKTKYPVLSLYRFAREAEASAEGIAHPVIVNSDNMTLIEGLPTRFELSNEWKIPERDLKYLIYGPLTCGDKLLVPAYPDKLLLIFLWEVIKVISIIGGVVLFIVWLISLFT